MNAPTLSLSPPVDQMDEIRALLGNIPDEEFEQRNRLRMCRTIATHRVVHAQTDMARQLLWIVVDTVTANLYASRPVELLTEMAQFCRRLLLCANQADEIVEAVDELA
jgi:hypothetical protein